MPVFKPVLALVTTLFLLTLMMIASCDNPLARTNDSPGSTPSSSSKTITGFAFTSPSATGIINESAHTIAVSVPFGTNLSALTPAITHTGSTISPAAGAAQNFTDPVSYTVTAKDNSTQSYVVTVTEAAASANADLSSLAVDYGILRPAFNPAITTYYVGVAYTIGGTTVTAVKADLNASVSISPAQPSTLEVTYPQVNTITVTVTAQNGATKVYTIGVDRLIDYGSPNIGNLKAVPGGTFQRDATVTNISTVSSFRMSTNEITRAQFTAVTGLSDPSATASSTGTSDPVQMVNWYDALVFCNKLSMAESLTPVYTIGGSTDPATWIAANGGVVPSTRNATWDAATVNGSATGYRLPTEMEWLWAAMGGDAANRGQPNTSGYSKAFAGSTGSNSISNYAWTSENSANKSHPVGSKLPNELGLYDMSGNVWEWCWDWYAGGIVGPVDDYSGPVSGFDRMEAGGGWSGLGSLAWVSSIGSANPNAQDSAIGFRVVRR